MSSDEDADDYYDHDENRRTPVFRSKTAPPRTLGTAVRLHPIKHRIPLYWFDLASGEMKSAPARKAPEMPERIGRTPGMSSVVADDRVFSGWARITGPAFAVCSGVTGVAAPEVPGGGLFGGEPAPPGVAPGAVEVFGGALLFGAGGGALPDAFDEEAPDDAASDDEGAVVDEAPLAPDCVAPPGALGSALRMIGKPSLPEPMTTTFAFGDCESKSVASIPRQRR